MRLKKKKVKKKYPLKIKRFGTLKKKILLLLLAGISLGLTKRPDYQWKIIKKTSKEWEKINQKRLKEIIEEFYQEKLVEYREKPDESIEIVLTEKGKTKALEGKIDELEIEIPKTWDKLWRVVIFDIPEKKKKARDALRRKLKELGFLEFQKSVFIFPYECKDEIEFIVEIFEIRKYVRYLIVKEITNEEELLLKFKLKK
ncbi:CRISPR-associated endonuclease Cas2 [bacterium]|nr:CRISPR-associated endonuclease Cas2 [bacterium]